MTEMTKIQKQIAEIKAKIASYGETKGKYAINKWWYYKVRKLEDELQDLEELEIEDMPGFEGTLKQLNNLNINK